MTRVRVGGLGDVDEVARLRRAWAEEQAGAVLPDPGFEESLAGWFRREHGQRVTWLAEEDGPAAPGQRAVGMLNMLVFTRMPRPADARGHRRTRWGYVANVFVAAEARNAGVGRLLVDACVAHADQQRFARLVLSPSERSVPFYARAGFVPAASLMVRESR